MHSQRRIWHGFRVISVFECLSVLVFELAFGLVLGVI